MTDKPLFCTKPDHMIIKWKFCIECAANNFKVNEVFYCQSCHMIIKTEVKCINHDSFMKPLQGIEGMIKDQVRKIKDKCQNQNFNDFQKALKGMDGPGFEFLKLIDQKQKFTQLICNRSLMQWLLDIKFWEAAKEDEFVKFESKVKSTVKSKIVEKDKVVAEIIQKDNGGGGSFIVVPQFAIEWPPSSLSKLIENQLEGLDSEVKKINKERQIFDFVIKLFSSFNRQQCYSALNLCDTLLQKYSTSKVLYLGKIRLLELIPGSEKQIPNVLKQISKFEPNFQATDLYFYYLAMSAWKNIESPEKFSKENKLIFYELKNKEYYTLEDADFYINNLNKAKAIRDKPIYYASLGLGYMVKNEYNQALRMFQTAATKMVCHNDALDLNKFWVEVHSDSGKGEYQAIMMNLQTRTLQFVTNLCKYFKNSQTYSELVKCCEELLERNPNHVNFKIQFIKSIIYNSGTLNEFRKNDSDKLAKAQLMIIQLKNVRQRQANKLQKRLLRMKARHEFKKQHTFEACEGYEQITKRTKLTSGSDYYNLAATLFKLFIQQKCDDELLLKQSYENINSALNMKGDKVKYMRLKFFICCYMNHFSQANRLYENNLKMDKEYSIDEQKYRALVEYMKDNLQDLDDQYTQYTPGK